MTVETSGTGKMTEIIWEWMFVRGMAMSSHIAFQTVLAISIEGRSLFWVRQNVKGLG